MGSVPILNGKHLYPVAQLCKTNFVQARYLQSKTIYQSTEGRLT